MVKGSILRIGGVVTLLALTLSVGETVWASICAPAQISDGLSGSAVQMASSAHTADGAHGCEAMSGPDTPSHDRCPLTPFTIQGCGAAASLPSVGGAIILPHPLIDTAAPAAVVRYTLLLSRPHFRPPRA